MPQQALVRTAMAISLGAIPGALCRYYLGLEISYLFGANLPYGTLLVNITGCFLMGLLATLSSGQFIRLHPDLWLLLLTGFLGSYTTFSSYELDSAKLLLQKNLQADLIYWAGSVFLGISSLQLGITLTEWMHKKLNQN
jgi:CrcB protein